MCQSGLRFAPNPSKGTHGPNSPPPAEPELWREGGLGADSADPDGADPDGADPEGANPDGADPNGPPADVAANSPGRGSASEPAPSVLAAPGSNSGAAAGSGLRADNERCGDGVALLSGD
jgi:hypothetical protein